MRKKWEGKKKNGETLDLGYPFFVPLQHKNKRVHKPYV